MLKQVLRNTFRRKKTSKKSTSATTQDGREWQAKGALLEDRVARILRAQGWGNVRTNVRIKDVHGHLSEIDVVAGRIFQQYFECKNYASHRAVPLSDVAKFKEVLLAHNIPLSRAAFVTTSKFTPRAKAIGIETIDGVQLLEWEARAVKSKIRRRLGVSAIAVLLLSGMAIHQAPFLVELFDCERTQFGRTLMQAHLAWMNKDGR